MRATQRNNFWLVQLEEMPPAIKLIDLCSNCITKRMLGMLSLCEACYKRAYKADEAKEALIRALSGEDFDYPWPGI